jgi:NAD(P)H-hydrate repair Nnr-like enzyme with NAD(P)H-hydrate dehydratase domain
MLQLPTLVISFLKAAPNPSVAIPLFQSALLAKDLVPEADVEVFDSATISLGTGYMVLEAARAAQATIVLKGAQTLIASPDGRIRRYENGSPWLATAGTGDVLTGMIVGLLAQGVAPWEAACAATYVHGLAGDLAAETIGQTSLIARDVIDHIPYALTNIGSA